jgi:hypothetical protein
MAKTLTSAQFHLNRRQIQSRQLLRPLPLRLALNEDISKLSQFHAHQPSSDHDDQRLKTHRRFFALSRRLFGLKRMKIFDGINWVDFGLRVEIFVKMFLMIFLGKFVN